MEALEISAKKVLSKQTLHTLGERRRKIFLTWQILKTLTI
jgi:hypothetical protein